LKYLSLIYFLLLLLLLYFSHSTTDGVGKSQGGGRVLILGATNVPWQIDSAIRRRFEKRVYISLPDAKSRTYMAKLHVGDTPTSLTEADFERLGQLTEGASGSDILVLVKEALMEPIKRCQQARQFLKDAKGNYLPCSQYPNCSRCPPKLSSDPPGMDYTCRHCGAVRMTLWEIPDDECHLLQCPLVSYKDFEAVLRHAFSTVSAEELARYTEWTAMFGQDGA
jgi:vacuolar protein-sorting-associated protein 4